MKTATAFFTSIFVLISFCSVFSQEKYDKGVFVEPKDGLYKNEILKGIEEFNNSEKAPGKRFKMNFSGMDLPGSITEFNSYWYNEPVSQGNTGTCWCFSTTSFFESEVYRLQGLEVKLSEMYTVYWEYVEKAKRFMQQRGNS
ncbi:MAG: peptidase C1, partial [Ignavibacteria bacterium]|nr:peptidase C1 [Ignavibacteria bacterium]